MLLIAEIDLMQRQLQHIHIVSTISHLYLIIVSSSPYRETHTYKLSIMYLIWLHRLGKTNVLSLDIKDGVVLPDEDISQDPELPGATLAKANAAAIVGLWRDKR